MHTETNLLLLLASEFSFICIPIKKCRTQSIFQKYLLSLAGTQPRSYLANERKNREQYFFLYKFDKARIFAITFIISKYLPNLTHIVLY